jgi:large subunit ribosomal protein L32
MGAVPKIRISTRRKGKRRADSTKNTAVPQLIKCPVCEAKKRPHMICQNCGKYTNENAS